MDNITTTFGLRIKELRKEKGYSQEYLANLAEMDRTYLSSVEQGRRNISIINIEKICKALDISIHDFFDCEEFRK